MKQIQFQSKQLQTAGIFAADCRFQADGVWCGILAVKGGLDVLQPYALLDPATGERYVVRLPDDIQTFDFKRVLPYA